MTQEPFPKDLRDQDQILMRDNWISSPISNSGIASPPFSGGDPGHFVGDFRDAKSVPILTVFSLFISEDSEQRESRIELVKLLPVGLAETGRKFGVNSGVIRFDG